MPVTVIANATNRGFPAAINQGLQVARGEYLVLLNNDVVVTDGWLDQLIALAEAKVAGGEPGHRRKLTMPGNGRSGRSKVEPVIGLVGPMSNYAAPPQLVEDVPYRDLDEMHAFAGDGATSTAANGSPFAKLSGFCLLIKRAVYEPSAGWMSGSGWGSSTTMTWPSGRGGPGSSWPWHTTCSSTTSAAGRSSATGSTPRRCWMRTRSGSPTSGACRGQRPARRAQPCGSAGTVLSRSAETQICRRSREGTRIEKT